MTADDVRKVLTQLAVKSESKVIVVLGNNPTIHTRIIQNAPDMLIKNFVWIGGQSWLESVNKSLSTESANTGNTTTASRLPLNVMAVQTETYSDPHFASYLSQISPLDSNAIPSQWLHQYWQSRFGCHLPHSPVTDTRFERMCTGEESLPAGDLMKSPHIQRTIALVNGISHGIKRFLGDKCPKNSHEMESIDDCPDNPRKGLREYILTELNGEKYNEKQNEIQMNGFLNTFLVWQRINGSKVPVLKSLDNNSRSPLKSGDSYPLIKANCVRNCDKCVKQFEANSEWLMAAENQYRPPMVVHLRRTWSLLAAVVSALGVVSVLICVIYFLLVFPVAVGTTVLGYQILFGLFMAYTTNFVFLIPVSTSVCALRRLGLSLSYAIIISGLLVKVLNTWRLMVIKNQSQPLRLSSPTALVFISGGLVFLQLILTTIWLFSYAPHPGLYDGLWKCSPNKSYAPHPGLYDGLWKCSPNKSFVLWDSEIIVSLLYVIQLLLITLFFAALTFKCYDQNREPRFIMACALCTIAVWVTWLIVESGNADPSLSIVCANSVNASLVMSLLYFRKLYLFSKISRKIRRERQMKTRLPHEPFADRQHQIYGALKSGSISGRMDWMCGSGDLDGTGGDGTLRTATRAPFERDYNDDNISSCGSVKSSASAQVQCTDLYPMEVYDGGSQFAPLSSLFSHTNIYGIIDDTPTHTTRH
ncbi:unnamed protein product [Oppiella nova]|uniref:G-protein coupled receptors family 3 profile domain-containing protein n=1 Tax=Oppiella nova TaxID=334625 RepID=A0A7R9MDG7_9ACAR|nr:unnamed protein product [Oppiella nova]CAG2174335.1 unnamed protein product [Oppiella nova]